MFYTVLYHCIHAHRRRSQVSVQSVRCSLSCLNSQDALCLRRVGRERQMRPWYCPHGWGDAMDATCFLSQCSHCVVVLGLQTRPSLPALQGRGNSLLAGHWPCHVAWLQIYYKILLHVLFFRHCL